MIGWFSAWIGFSFLGGCFFFHSSYFSTVLQSCFTSAGFGLHLSYALPLPLCDFVLFYHMDAVVPFHWLLGFFYCHVGIDLHTFYVPFLYSDASHDRMKAARLGEFINRNLLDFVSSNRNRNRRIYCLCKLEHLIFHFTQTVMYIWRSSCFVIIFLTLTKFDST